MFKSPEIRRTAEYAIGVQENSVKYPLLLFFIVLYDIFVFRKLYNLSAPQNKRLLGAWVKL